VQIHRYGDDALLVEVDGHHAALALYRAARAHRVEARDIVPAAGSVLFDGPRDPESLRRDLPRWEHEPPLVSGATVEVPTRYDGPDLEEVGRLWDMTVAEVVATHSGLEHEVAFCGFAPGFAYCVGLPERLRVPRRHDPRPRVPAGSVAVADRYTGVYPSASPGGWQLLGTTDLVLWDATREDPATLSPGTRVRFVVA
jgi:KipI family sensor histidine kinase inhibitor